MEKKVVYPEMFDLWSNMRKIGWIQDTYGYFDEKEDRLIIKSDTPEEILKLYDKLWDQVEEQQNKGYDVD